MIKVFCPPNNQNERKYIVTQLLTNFLNVEVEVHFSCKNLENWVLELPNKAKIIFEDHFFCKFNDSLQYLKKENCPASVELMKNQFAGIEKIPILFGNGKFERKALCISCGVDIFASAFFMLTRWEEYVKPERDLHNRFPARASLAATEGFLQIPVVDKYVELLRKMLLFLGYELTEGQSRRIVFSHDVDVIQKWKSWKQTLRSAIGSIVRNMSPREALEKLAEFYLIKQKKINDPYNSFDWLMDQSEIFQAKSHFYFMSGGSTKFETNYLAFFPGCREIIENIKKRGHLVGFHGSYNSYRDLETFSKEKEILESFVGMRVKEGRQHYLRFEVPYTWQVWEDAGMVIDSTCGFAEIGGFRCGTSREFNVFNILSRRQLKLIERPLIYMDVTNTSYRGFDSENSVSDILYLFDKCCSNFTLLWHNNYPDRNEFLSVLREIKKNRNSDDSH